MRTAFCRGRGRFRADISLALRRRRHGGGVCFGKRPESEAEAAPQTRGGGYVSNAPPFSQCLIVFDSAPRHFFRRFADILPPLNLPGLQPICRRIAADLRLPAFFSMSTLWNAQIRFRAPQIRRRKKTPTVKPAKVRRHFCGASSFASGARSINLANNIHAPNNVHSPKRISAFVQNCAQAHYPQRLKNIARPRSGRKIKKMRATIPDLPAQPTNAAAANPAKKTFFFAKQRGAKRARQQFKSGFASR